MRFEKAERLLQLAERMQASSEGVSLGDIEERFGVSRRTAERMRDAVLRVFPRGEEKRGDERVKRWKIGTGSLGHFSRLSADDLSDLQVGIEHLRLANLPVQAENMERLWVKLKGAVENFYRVDADLEVLLEAEGYAVRPGPKSQVVKKVFFDLREAIKGSYKVKICYAGRIKGEVSDRVVCPYGFLYGVSRHYLVAFCEKAGALRTFSLTRIRTLSVLETYFEREDGFDLRAYSERSFGVYQEEIYKVCWKFDGRVKEGVRDYFFHSTQRIEEEEDGSCVVRFEASGLKEMCWHLFKWGDCVEILEPEALKEVYRELIEGVRSRLEGGVKF